MSQPLMTVFLFDKTDDSTNIRQYCLMSPYKLTWEDSDEMDTYKHKKTSELISLETKQTFQTLVKSQLQFIFYIILYIRINFKTK